MVGAYQQSGSCVGERCRCLSLELNSVTCREQEQTTMGGQRGVRLISTDNRSVHYHPNQLREGDSGRRGSIRLLEPKERMWEGGKSGGSYREARVGGSPLRDAISGPTPSLPRSKTRWIHGSRPRRRRGRDGGRR